jgi:hypothetical protein
MIRYVVAVLLTTTLLGVGLLAVEDVSAVRGERQLERELSAIEGAAVSLLTHDDPVPGDSPPRRVLDVDLPADGFGSAGVETLVFSPANRTDGTIVRYQFDGRPAATRILDVPILNAAEGTSTIDLSGATGSQTIVLELVLGSDGDGVVQTTIRR